MIKSFQILKQYYKLANIKFYLLFLEFLFLLIPSILSVISPIVAANIISCITVYDFNKAIFFLSIEFSFIVVSAISYFLYHFVSTKVNKTIIMNFEKFIYKNVEENKNINKISLSVIDNIWVCLDFNKELLYKLCFFIKSVILLFIIFYFNFIIGIILITVSIFSFFLLQITDKKIQNSSKHFSTLNAESLQLFNSIQKNISNESNPIIITSLKDKYFGFVSKSVETNNKINLYFNINNNIISLILKTTVFASTIFLITQIKTTVLTFSLYLILTPYLTSSSQNLISFFEVFSKFGVVENILKEFESLKFQTQEPQTQKSNFSTYNLYFFNVSQEQKNNSLLKDISFTLKNKSSLAIFGDVQSGLETIFLLLQKKLPISKGSILIDDKNINELQTEEYNSIISFTTKKPYFYNISIYENLYMVCENKTKIQKAITSFGLKSYIDNLPNKINTILSDDLNNSLIFFLGILRSYLSGAKIICIYDFPNKLTQQEVSVLKHIFSIAKKECSLLLLSHQNYIKNIEKNTLVLKEGILKNAK